MKPEFVVTPTTLVYGGDAMGRMPDGRAIFIPFALPGEKVHVRVVEEKRGHLRADLVEILEPVPMRIMPRCRHFGVCGGCHYQHIPYPQQLEIKKRILVEQLERLGGLKNPPVLPMYPSPEVYNYRNHIQFHLAPSGRLAFQAARRGGLVEISECHLPEESIHLTWPSLHFEPGVAVDRISLRAGSGDEITLTLEGASNEAPEFETDLPISALYLGPDGVTLLAGEDVLRMVISGREFQVSAESFFQVNSRQAANMVNFLLDKIPPSRDQSLLELYCGAGLFSAFLAPHVRRLAGVEVSPSACRDFAANLDEFTNVELYEGTAGEILQQLDWKADIVLADPPRAGIEPPAMDALLRMAPEMLLYVSCDPATLARDTRKLTAAGYRLIEAAPFDMFPQTYHIETIAVFTRQDPGVTP